MSNCSILDLPIEVIHRILDDLDALTIISSVRCVCKQLNLTVKSYDRLKLQFQSVKTYNFKMISDFVKPSNVISMELYMNSCYQKDFIQLILSNFNVHEFVRLRSLVLYQLNIVEMEELLKNIKSNRLLSLVVNFNGKEAVKVLSIVYPIIIQTNLRKLHMNLDCKNEEILWPIQSTLEEVTIHDCSYQEYYTILSNSFRLKKIVMKNCITKNIDQTSLSLSASSSNSAKRQRTSKNYTELISLTMSDCKLPMKDLEIFLLLTPSLVHLKLASTRSIYDSMFDGYYWEQFIQNNLPSLNKFEFFFTYNSDEFNGEPHFDSIISPFSTPFWLNNKHWFVTCDYIPRISKIIVYTAPVSMGDLQDYYTVFQISSTNTICHCIMRSNPHPFNDSRDEGRVLKLTKNRIDDNLLQSVIIELRNYQTLTQLYLSQNSIGDIGVQNLADELKKHPTLEILDLEFNLIEDTGAEYLYNTFKENKTLKRLVLCNNCASEKMKEYLTKQDKRFRCFMNENDDYKRFDDSYSD